MQWLKQSVRVSSCDVLEVLRSTMLATESRKNYGNFCTKIIGSSESMGTFVVFCTGRYLMRLLTSTQPEQSLAKNAKKLLIFPRSGAKVVHCHHDQVQTMTCSAQALEMVHGETIFSLVLCFLKQCCVFSCSAVALGLSEWSSTLWHNFLVHVYYAGLKRGRECMQWQGYSVTSLCSVSMACRTGWLTNRLLN